VNGRGRIYKLHFTSLPGVLDWSKQRLDTRPILKSLHLVTNAMIDEPSCNIRIAVNIRSVTFDREVFDPGFQGQRTFGRMIMVPKGL
jgi:hypothetical protein